MNSKATLYALLVGINDYPNVNKLAGCVADVEAVQAYLNSHFTDMNPQIKTLLDAEATKQNIIQAFRSHLSQAKAGDTVYFHFSGHGSRENAPEEFWQFFPEKKNETMVCYDSRLEGGSDLADKELAVLLSELAQNRPYLIVCMDCCHSGSGTRENTQLGLKRQAEKEGNSRKIATYLDGHFERMLQNTQKIEMPMVAHIALAACRASEVAWETVDKRGLFTSTLLETLEEKGSKITYADLFRETRIKIRQKGAQEPQFDLYGGMRAFDFFLSQKPSGQITQHKIYFDPQRSEWKTDFGALQGMSTESTELIRFQLFNDEEKSFVSENAITEAVVKSVKSNVSILSIPEAEKLNPKTIYTGLISNLPPPSPTLYSDLSEEEKKALIPPFLFEELPGEQGADYILRKSGQEYEVIHPKSQKLINKNQDRDFIKTTLRKIALWENTRKIENSKTKLKPEDLEVALYLLDAQGNRQKDAQGQDICLLPEKESNSFGFNLGNPPVLYCAYELTNKTNRDLFVAALIISPLYGIFLLNKKRIPAGTTASMNRAMLNNQGILAEGTSDMLGFWPGTEQDPECIVQIKYLATTEEELDTYPLEQADFSLNIYTKDLGETRRTENLGRFLGIANTTEVQEEDWFTKDIFFRLSKNQQKISDQGGQLLQGKIKIKAPQGFQADIQLGNAVNSTRGTKSQEGILGQLFPDNSNAQAFSLDAASRSTQNNTVFELSDIQGHLSPENPLELEIDTQLGEEEILLPFAFDGEDVIPIGWSTANEAGKTLVQIEKIPEEQVRSKSLGRALKFCLYKLSAPLFKTPSNGWNQLRAVEYTREGKALYETDQEKIRAKVQAADKILLLIHGIIGNTSEQVDFAYSLVQDKVYDLILTFDYENLHTPIEQIAYELKRRLVGDEAAYQGEKLAGIGISPQKKIDILAHSMGGLVSRWMIEQREGHPFVHRLVMCGTPNGGSVFGQISDYRQFASIALTLGVNALLPFESVWSLGVLIGGLKIAQNGTSSGAILTQTLAQMKQDSPFIHHLNVDGKPANISYTILAGDVQKYELENTGIFKRVYEKSLKLIGNYANSNQPNDVAVLVKDIKESGKNQGVEIYDVACHHLNYFTEKNSVALLRQILKE